MTSHTAADGRILVDVTSLVYAVLAAVAVGAVVLGYGVVAAINDWQTPVDSLISPVDGDPQEPRYHEDLKVLTV